MSRPLSTKLSRRVPTIASAPVTVSAPVPLASTPRDVVQSFVSQNHLWLFGIIILVVMFVCALSLLWRAWQSNHELARRCDDLERCLSERPVECPGECAGACPINPFGFSFDSLLLCRQKQPETGTIEEIDEANHEANEEAHEEAHEEAQDDEPEWDNDISTIDLLAVPPADAKAHAEAKVQAESQIQGEIQAVQAEALVIEPLPQEEQPQEEQPKKRGRKAKKSN